MSSDTIIPDSLKEVTDHIILQCLTNTYTSNSNLRVNDPKSLFGKVLQKLTNRKESTITERKYLQSLWRTSIKDDIENQSHIISKKLSKKERRRVYRQQLYELKLDLKVDIAVEKALKRKERSKDSDIHRATKKKTENAIPSIQEKAKSPCADISTKKPGIMQRLKNQIRKRKNDNKHCEKTPTSSVPQASSMYPILQNVHNDDTYDTQKNSSSKSQDNGLLPSAPPASSIYPTLPNVPNEDSCDTQNNSPSKSQDNGLLPSAPTASSIYPTLPNEDTCDTQNNLSSQSQENGLLASAPPTSSMYPILQHVNNEDSCDTTNNLLPKSQHTGQLSLPTNEQDIDDDFELPSIRTNMTPWSPMNIPSEDLEKLSQLQRDKEKLQQIIQAFNKKVEVYPTYQCPICKRKVYKLNGCVRNYVFTKYIIDQMRRFDFNDFEVGQKVFMCRRCADTFSRRKIPTMIYMNNMEMEPTPECISKLTDTEIRLISQVKLFMKIYHLCKGRAQQALKGSCIHFPQSVDQVIEQLPLSPDKSDIVIVNETNQAGEILREFQVRGKEIYEALHYLKQNNPLYVNIEIGTQLDRDLQINQVYQCNKEDNNVDSEVARIRVLSQPSRGYTVIDATRAILRATIHQASLEVFPSGGNQCSGMSACAVAHAFVQPIGTWSSHDLDNILFSGDRYYVQIRPDRDRYLEATELNGIVTCFQNLQVRVDVITDMMYYGMFNIVEGLHITRLHTSIQEFIDSQYTSSVITAGAFCMALIKLNNKVYLFDSHARGPMGYSSEVGKACVVSLTYEIAPQKISDMIHRNCQPRGQYKDNMNDLELAQFQYQIRPIICSYHQGRDENLEQVQNIEEINLSNENIHKSQQPAHDSNIPAQALGNPNSMMLDCVIRADEPREPALKEYMESCRLNKNAVPAVEIQRENGRPLYASKEKRLEELAFVKAFPHGRYGYEEDRKLKITPLDYYQQRIMSCNTNFHTNEYLFYAMNQVESHTLQQKIAVCGNMASNNGKDNDSNNLPGLENVHLYMQGIRGSGSYWRKYTNDVLAMIEQLGVPTFFLTISYHDLNSSDSLTALWKAKYGEDAELPSEPSEMPYQQRKDLLNNYPVAAARHFNNKVNVILNLLKTEGEFIFGANVIDFTYRIEFQGRGSPHVHALLWLDVNLDYSSAEGIDFIDKNVSCSLNVSYRDLVMRYQNHAHRNTCYKKHNNCRFGFPRKSSNTTKVLDEEEIAKNHGRFVELKRTMDEIMVNNYHPKLLQILRCNMDIQLVTGCRAIAYYVGKYMSKGEPNYLREEIRNIIKTFKTDSKSSYFERAKKIANLIIKHREISAQEAAWRLTHLPLRKSSRATIFIPTYQPQNRLRLVRKDTLLSDKPELGLNIIDRYMNRPLELENLSLIEFAAWWRPKRNSNREEEDMDLIEGEEEDVVNDFVAEANLLNNKGKIVRRKFHCVVRYPKFKPAEQQDDYLYSLMMLYYPFRNENFIENFLSIKDAFHTLKGQFRTNHDDQIINPELLEQINAVLLQLASPDENAGGDEEINENYNMFFEEEGEPVYEHDMFQPVQNGNDYNAMQSKLNSMTTEQRQVFERVRTNLCAGNSGEQLLLCVQGTAGTGKSFVISCLDYLIKTLHQSKERALVKAAPTGVAARNIGGVTLHKAFSLGVEQHGIAQFFKLGGRTLHEKRLIYKDVEYIILDEVSMISYQVLRMISMRLGELMGNDLPFGGLNIIIFGDLLQLKPVRGHWCFNQPEYFSHETHLWRLFSFYELTTVLRQRNRDNFFYILQRLRIGTLLRQDIEILRQRLLHPSSTNYQEMLAGSSESLHLYPKVKQVDLYNSLKLDEISKTGVRVYQVNSIDTYGNGFRFGQRAPTDLLYKDIRKCAGIPHTLNLAIGTKYMLKWNIDPISGLCNGSVGVLRAYQWTALRRDQLHDGDLPEYVLIEFDGEIAARHYSNVPGFERCVAIRPKTFEFTGKRGTQIFRYQLPIVTAFSISIHKSQGLSLDSCTVHLGKHLFTYGLAFVAMSRVRTFNGLYITEVDDSKLLVNKKKVGPCSPEPLKELYRLKLLDFLGCTESEIDFLDDLVTWVTEYVMCNKCKLWKCLCTC